MKKIFLIASDPFFLEDALLRILIFSRQNGINNIECPDLFSNVISNIYKKRGYAIADMNESEEQDGQQ